MPSAWTGMREMSEDELQGYSLAKDLQARGVNPWDLKQAANAFAQDVGIPDSALLRVVEFPSDDRYGGFHGRSMPPYNPQNTKITLDPNQSPEERLLTLRHEMEHASDQYQLLDQFGPRILKDLRGPKHFLGGDQTDVERGFTEKAQLRQLLGFDPILSP